MWGTLYIYIYIYVHRWSKCDASRNAEPSNMLLSRVEIETLPKLSWLSKLLLLWSLYVVFFSLLLPAANGM